MSGKYKKYSSEKQILCIFQNRCPEHWNSSTVKYSHEIKLGKMLQPVKKSGNDVLKSYLRAANIQENGIELHDINEMWFSINEIKNLNLEDGDLLISEGGDVGRCAIWEYSDVEMYFQNALNRVRPKTGITKYLYYWMYFLKKSEFIDIICNRSTIPHYTAEKVENSPLLYPPISEQTQIANFLDYETAKIDTLIEKQKKLIELLKEKRQAVISHAVTRGLNPDAPMKDSGVEWLGEVPEHWEVSKLKYNSEIIDCKHITAEFFDVGIPVASISEVKEWSVNLDNAKLTNEKFYSQLIEGNRKPLTGDIIFSRNASVGDTAIVERTIERFALGQDVCLIRRKKEILPDFLLLCLKSASIYAQLDLSMVGSTFKRINVDNIRNFQLVLPPISNQKQLINDLLKQISKVDKILLKSSETIALLQERRTALISAAVTGKIDVRDWVAPDRDRTCVVEEVLS